jgi:hypothetical protein
MAMALQTGIISLNSRKPSELQACNTETFTQVTFPSPFPEGAKVVVIPFVQTFNGPDTPGLRIADVSPTGFKVRMNELVAHGGQHAISNGVHCAETIGWIAFAV